MIHTDIERFHIDQEPTEWEFWIHQHHPENLAITKTRDDNGWHLRV